MFCPSIPPFITVEYDEPERVGMVCASYTPSAVSEGTKSKLFVKVPYFIDDVTFSNAFKTGVLFPCDALFTDIVTLFISPATGGSFNQPTSIVTLPNFLVM